jgi:RNA polymerase sigma factor (sigma-70 family)
MSHGSAREPDCTVEREAGSITRAVDGVRQGRPDSMQQLWHRYYAALLRVARQRLGSSGRHLSDEEDIVVQAFYACFHALENGRYPDIRDRSALWRLLLTITANKVIDEHRRQSRRGPDGARILGESAIRAAGTLDSRDGFQQLMADDPTPSFVAALQEDFRNRLALLDADDLRQIALWKFEGFGNSEIAERLNVTERTVERKLRRIRALWSSAADDAAPTTS